MRTTLLTLCAVGVSVAMFAASADARPTPTTKRPAPHVKVPTHVKAPGHIPSKARAKPKHNVQPTRARNVHKTKAHATHHAATNPKAANAAKGRRGVRPKISRKGITTRAAKARPKTAVRPRSTRRPTVHVKAHKRAPAPVRRNIKAEARRSSAKPTFAKKGTRRAPAKSKRPKFRATKKKR